MPAMLRMPRKIKTHKSNVQSFFGSFIRRKGEFVERIISHEIQPSFIGPIVVDVVKKNVVRQVI